jgi:hypothetical protein
MDRFSVMSMPINERSFMIERLIDQRNKENEESKKQSKKK